MSAHLDLLLQSLRECCHKLQRRTTEIIGLSDQGSFSRTRLWVKGIADTLRDTGVDLQEWCDVLEKNKHMQWDHYRKEIDATIQICDWVKELTKHIKELVQDATATSCTQTESRDILGEIEQDVDIINRQITTIKALDQLDAKSNETVRDKVRQSQDQVRSIKDLFEERIRNLLPEQRDGSFCILGERGCLKFEQLDWFWSKIPRPQRVSRGKFDRYDGVLISDAYIDKARATLLMFIEAWLAVQGNPVDRPSLDIMQHMPAIACVLYACNKHALFNKFIAAEIKDSALDEGWESFSAKVEDAIGDEALAKQVVGQFSRVKARAWPKGQNLLLEWSEPLPLREIEKLRDLRGPVGVYKVEDAWNPNRFFALKVVKTETADDTQLADLKNEIHKLNTIGQEDHGHHIVKCIKTYERRGQSSEIGMLLLPVASSDLNKFLNMSCQDYKFRKFYKLSLMQAFGCLSYGLAYLHNVREMRHRDVKPHNILFLRETSSSPTEFLWADFGLAFVFREQGFSGEKNPSFGATPEYEAPEIDPNLEGMHTRAADIFALGCMFLEITWVLTISDNRNVDQIGLRRDYWEHAKRRYYKHHLRGLNDWVTKMDAKLKTAGNKQLRLVLQLAGKMIHPSPDKRPKIGEVVMELWNVKPSEGADRPFCARCVTKMRVDTGKNPQHPNIFKHKIGHRPSNGTAAVQFQPFGSAS